MSACENCNKLLGEVIELRKERDELQELCAQTADELAAVNLRVARRERRESEARHGGEG